MKCQFAKNIVIFQNAAAFRLDAQFIFFPSESFCGNRLLCQDCSVSLSQSKEAVLKAILNKLSEYSAVLIPIVGMDQAVLRQLSNGPVFPYSLIYSPFCWSCSSANTFLGEFIIALLSIHVIVFLFASSELSPLYAPSCQILLSRCYSTWQIRLSHVKKPDQGNLPSWVRKTE